MTDQSLTLSEILRALNRINHNIEMLAEHIAILTKQTLKKDKKDTHE